MTQPRRMPASTTPARALRITRTRTETASTKGRRRATRLILRRSAQAAAGLALLLATSPTSAQTVGETLPRMAVAGSAPAETGPASAGESWGFVNRPGRFGLGLNVGNLLTGASAELWAAQAVAFQAALGEGAEGNDLRSHLDLLFSVSTWTSADGQYRLPAYLGVGGAIAHRFAAGQTPSFTEGGFRIPLGLSVLVRDNPVALFFEIAPEFVVRSNDVAGKYGFYVDGAIGARYFF
jgi:hypothetical protein